MMFRRLSRFSYGVFLVAAALAPLLSGPCARAGDDPLFGDLPGRLEVIDEVLQDVGASRRFGGLIESLSSRIALESSIGGVAPGGFFYDIGPLGLPEKTSANLGTIWTQGAEPVGPGRLSVGASYTYLKYDSYEGRSLKRFLDFKDSSPAIDVDLDLSTQILAFSILYGLSEEWEAGVFVPWVAHRSRGDIYLGDRWVGDADGQTEGLGDVIILTKYRLAGAKHWAWSVTGRLKTPSGDPDKYLGTGETDGGIRTVFSFRLDELEANMEAGYTWSGLGSGYDSLVYRAGLAYGVAENLTLAAEIIGNYSREPVFDTIDAGFGLKFNPTDGLVIQGGVRIPLDPRDGLRANYAPMLGLEWRF